MPEEIKQPGNGQPVGTPSPMDALNEKLKPLGLSADLIMPIFQPIVMEAVKAVLGQMKLGNVIEATTEKIVAEKLDALVKQLPQGGGNPSPEGTAGVPARLKQPPGGMDMSQMLMIAKMLGLGPKEDGGLTGLVTQAKLMGEAFGAITKPFLDSFYQGRQAALQDISALQKNPDAINRITGEGNKT